MAAGQNSGTVLPNDHPLTQPVHPEVLIDIEHVQVKDDPREWSRSRKVSARVRVTTELAYSVQR